MIRDGAHRRESPRKGAYDKAKAALELAGAGADLTKAVFQVGKRSTVRTRRSSQRRRERRGVRSAFSSRTFQGAREEMPCLSGKLPT